MNPIQNGFNFHGDLGDVQAAGGSDFIAPRAELAELASGRKVRWPALPQEQGIGIMIYHWLVVWNINFIFPLVLGE